MCACNKELMVVGVWNQTKGLSERLLFSWLTFLAFEHIHKASLLLLPSLSLHIEDRAHTQKKLKVLRT